MKRFIDKENNYVYRAEEGLRESDWVIRMSKADAGLFNSDHLAVLANASGLNPKIGTDI
jgi:hypothetical protein